MNYSNAQILAAVLNKWLQPVVQQFVGQKMSSLPLFAGVENKVKSTGWVRPTWSMAAELSPLMESLTATLVEPLLTQWLGKMPDAAIPQMAHAVVCKDIENGGLTLFDGNVVFDKADMEQLKRLLDYNLPPKQDENHYQVKTSEE